jgi:hypothetical protein
MQGALLSRPIPIAGRLVTLVAAGFSLQAFIAIGVRSVRESARTV